MLVQKEAYLLALSRYAVLNPVRAGMAKPTGLGKQLLLSCRLCALP